MFPASAVATLLGLTFAWAAASKLIRWSEWRGALAGYGLSQPVRGFAAAAVPAAEGAVAGLLFAGITRAGGAATLLLLAAFSAAMLRARAARGDRLPCGCFGKVKELDYRVLLVRNAVLAVGAGVLLLHARDVDGVPSLPEGGGWLPATLTIAGVGLIAWVVATALQTSRRGQA